MTIFPREQHPAAPAAGPPSRLYLVFRFAKQEPANFLSHLDLMRSFERAARRVQLPLAFSAGFNPGPRLSLASALALGHTSEAELGILQLSRAPAGAPNLVEIFNAQMPAGLRWLEAEIVSTPRRNPLPEAERAEYLLRLQLPTDMEEKKLQEVIDALIGAGDLPVERAPKGGGTCAVQTRTGLLGLRVEHFESPVASLSLDLLISGPNSVRPADVIAALGAPWGDLRVLQIHRRRLCRRDGGNLWEFSQDVKTDYR